VPRDAIQKTPNSRDAVLFPKPAGTGRFRKNSAETSPARYLPPIDLRLYTPDFTVIDENEDFLVIDKPPHLMVHPSVPGNPPTLLDGLEALCAYELACGGHLSLVNRLDRETSGIVLVAKHKAAARTLGMAMERREFRKSYLAVVWGWPEEDSFLIDGSLLRKGEVEPSPIWVKQIVHPEGKESQTRFEVVRRFERETTNGSRFSLVRCHPRTGRMHQIRVHAAHAGHAIVGDKLYGPDERPTGAPRGLPRMGRAGLDEPAPGRSGPLLRTGRGGKSGRKQGKFIGCKSVDGSLASPLPRSGTLLPDPTRT
jgi:23S rRNA pseudouridine1911/1915/1917 synthase